ncbi:DnaJ domain-containing protein [Vibrio sp. CAIM 722]|uniref:DnaJ domain-containing protein n=1 Tax=Vibrio eleionomae TaxID=2653505 RepID=A0A7X4LPF7_9VIBR|nr:J domain-containing protein [Vibrio eleionomae]MZI95729.1 DnaJ domain-containing protein [Vibrio eleionomae]
MNNWEILGIEPTSDLSIIKKAYRSQLKIHHPEEDPQGFKQVRAAYEAIMENINRDESTLVTTFTPETKLTQPAAQTSNEESTTVVPIQKYQSLMLNAATRFDLTQWQQWRDDLLLTSLDIQQTVASYVLDDVLNKRWLPGEMIDIFWQTFDWEELLSGDAQQYELGEFLQRWTTTKSLIPLSNLSQLADAAQRATLSFIIPLTKALNIGNVDAINYWLWQPTCLPWNLTLEYLTTIMQCCNSCNWYPPAIYQDLLEHLTSPDIINQLTDVQLEILSEATLKAGDIDTVIAVAKQMIAKEQFGSAADLLYQVSSKAKERDYSLLLANLLQKWSPLPHAFWRCEHSLNPNYHEQPTLSHRWLYQSLFDNADDIFLHYLDFKDESGLIVFLTQALWNADHGSLVWQVKLLENLLNAQEQATPFETLMLQLTYSYCSHRLQEQNNGAESLLIKLQAYDTDAFLGSESLTEAEIDSLTSVEWIQCLERHPLVPDSWLTALLNAEKISSDLLEENRPKLQWVYETIFYRIKNPEYRLSSIYQHEPFTGVFQWLTLFNSHYTPDKGLSGNQLLSQLSALPAHQQQGPLGCLVTYFDHEKSYSSDWVESISPFSEQHVFQAMVYQALQKVYQQHSLEELNKLALTGNLESLAALAFYYRYRQIKVATFYWQLFRVYTYNKTQFEEFHNRMTRVIYDEAENNNLVLESYKLSQPEAITLFITSHVHELPTPDEFSDTVPDKEAKPFTYPANYLLSILFTGWRPEGYDIYPLEYFERNRNEQTEEEQQAADIALVHLNNLHQKELNQALNNKKSVKTFSRGQVGLFALAFIALWFYVFDYPISNEAVRFSALWCFDVGITTIAQLGLSLRIMQIVPSTKKRKVYLGFTWGLYLVAIGLGSFWVAVATCVIHVGRIWMTRVIFSRGRWAKKVIKDQQVNIGKYLGISNA